MSLLAILISLVLKKLLPALHGLRSLGWIGPYQQWIQQRLATHEKWRGIPTLLIIVLLPVIGIAIAQHLLNDVLVFFGFVFSIVVLTYCLGPKDQHQLVHQYLDAEEVDDQESAQATLQEIFPEQSVESLPEDKASRSRLLIDTVLIQTHDQLLAILFWFIILGPMGALLYRLTLEILQHEQLAHETTDNETGDSEFSAAVARLYYLLAWIPSHLAALSYAVMGSFVHALHAWQNEPHEQTAEASNNAYLIDDKAPQSHRLLIHIGVASLQFDSSPPQEDAQQNEAIRETLGLCGRSLVAWITVLALMTLAGWAS
jgi:AmpE protein